MRTELAPTQWTASALLRSQFHHVHRRTLLSLEGSQSGAAIDVARLVLCEDLTVNAFLLGRQPLALFAWQGRTGLSELPRLVPPIDWRAWAARVQLDVELLRHYAEAVYSATDDMLSVPLSDSTVCVLNALLLTHCVALPAAN